MTLALSLTYAPPRTPRPPRWDFFPLRVSRMHLACILHMPRLCEVVRTCAVRSRRPPLSRLGTQAPFCIDGVNSLLSQPTRGRWRWRPLQVATRLPRSVPCHGLCQWRLPSRRTNVGAVDERALCGENVVNACGDRMEAADPRRAEYKERPDRSEQSVVECWDKPRRHVPLGEPRGGVGTSVITISKLCSRILCLRFSNLNLGAPFGLIRDDDAGARVGPACDDDVTVHRKGGVEALLHHGHDTANRHVSESPCGVRQRHAHAGLDVFG